MVHNHVKIIKEIANEKDGITIISLVITIVIICILAGITLNITIGDNGIIKQSKLIANDIIKSEEDAQLQINLLNSEDVQEDYTATTLADVSSPNMSMDVTANSIVVGITITETESGLDRIEYSIDNGQTWVTNPANKAAKQYVFKNLEPGYYTVKARAYDKSGNVTEELSGEVKLGYPMPDRGTYQYGELGTGTDENGDYYAINQLPEGIYYSNGNAWAPEARISAEKLRQALGVSADKIKEGESIAGVEGTAKTVTESTRLTFSNNLYGDSEGNQSTGNITLTNLPYSSMKIVSSNHATATYENGTLKILFDSNNNTWTNNDEEDIEDGNKIENENNTSTVPSITIDLIP